MPYLLVEFQNIWEIKDTTFGIDLCLGVCIGDFGFDSLHVCEWTWRDLDFF